MAGNTSFEGDARSKMADDGMPATADTPPAPSIATAWVKNNVLAAVVSGTASLAIYGVRHAAGVAGAEPGLAGITILFVVAIVLSAFTGIAYGVLTGAVLQRIVPLLPVKSWIALNAGMAVAAALLSEIGLILLPSTPATDDSSMGEVLLVGLIAGAVLGAAIGWLQALVLRKAALGASAWIAWSVVAFVVAVVLVAGSGKLWETGGGFAGELANQAVAFLAYVIMSGVMLPARLRLRDPLSTAGAHFS
jgi:hypothetical protein